MKQWRIMHINHVTPADMCMFITMFTWASYLSLSWPTWIKSTTSNAVSSRSIFVPSSHLHVSDTSVFFQAFPPKTCMHFCCTPYVPHTPPILSSLVWSSEEHLMRSTHHKAPHYAIFSILLLLSSSEPKITSSASCSETASACVLPLTRQTKFHAKIKHTAVIGVIPNCLTVSTF